MSFTSPSPVVYHLSLECVTKLPPHSEVSHLNRQAVLHEIMAAGFSGVQGFWMENDFLDPEEGYAKLAREMGLAVSIKAVARKKGDLNALFQLADSLECETMSLHLGTGLESDDEACRLVEQALSASQPWKGSVYLETHRGTITQDIYRTVQLVGKFPELRFTGDFSHWYTGQDLSYGDFQNKVNFIRPVWQRVRYVHARLSHPGRMQADQFEVDSLHARNHFAIWKMAFLSTMAEEVSKEAFYLCPELIGPPNYASFGSGDQGIPVEEGDRWLAALHLKRLAEDLFAS